MLFVVSCLLFLVCCVWWVWLLFVVGCLLCVVCGFGVYWLLVDVCCVLYALLIVFLSLLFVVCLLCVV